MSEKECELNLAALQAAARAWSESPEAEAAFAEIAEQVAATSQEIRRISRIDPELRHRPMTI